MMLLRLLVLLPLLVFSGSGFSNTQQKPGLWENTVKVNLGGAFPQINELMIEQMEAAGIELPFARPMTTQTCLTPEQVRQQSLPDFNDPDSGCSTRNVRRQGDQVLGDITCNGQIQGRGSLMLNLHGAESYSGRQHFEGLAQGLPITMTTDIHGRWVQTECGDIRPLGQ